MRWAILISFGLHALGALALWHADTPREAVPPDAQMPAEIQVMLSDPERGAAEVDAPEPPVAPEVMEAALSDPPSLPPTPDQLPVEPQPPEPQAEASIPIPPPPPPPAQPSVPPKPPVPQATTPRSPAAPALQAGRAGASPTGREGGLTDIVTGRNVVPPDSDPGYANIPPRYPPEAARRGQQGRVVLSVLVATDGGVISVEVAESSGYPVLDRAARDAVAKWRFRPGMRDGMAMPSTIPVPLVFILEN